MLLVRVEGDEGREWGLGKVEPRTTDADQSRQREGHDVGHGQHNRLSGIKAGSQPAPTGWTLQQGAIVKISGGEQRSQERICRD